MSPWTSRTPEEREAARREREARRASRRGDPPPEPPSAGPEPPAAVPPPPPVAVPPPQFAPLPSRAPATAVEAHDDAATGEHEFDTGEHEFDTGEHAFDTGEHEFDTGEHDVAEPAPPPLRLDGPDEPSGTRRVSGLERADEGHRGRQDRAAPRRHRRGISRAGRLLAIVAILLAAALIWFLVSLFQPFHGQAGAKVRIVIPPHYTSSQIGDLLERDRIVNSSFFFQLRASLAGERGDLRSGTYTMQIGMSYGDALKVLTTPPPAARVTSLTVIEGQNRRSLDRLLRSQGVKGSYLLDTRHSPLLDPRRYGAPRSTASLEGFLFPNTYQLREPITTAALVADQLRAFPTAFATVRTRSGPARRLTPYQLLTVASIIQGEARTGRDRALISSVIYNRLQANMLLQMDDTVRYAVDNFRTPITVSQLHSASPWNTYTHKGLPPTPISSPGLDAIRAAANPARTNYLFFVVKPCGNGEQVFTSTYAQFLVLQNRYYAARTQRGGRSPEFCH